MIQEIDAPAESRWFASVMLVDDASAGERRAARRRREETSAEVLAYEITRYMPELASALVKSGRRRLLAA